MTSLQQGHSVYNESVTGIQFHGRKHSPSITLGPEVEALRLDLGVQLGQPAQESLQDFPGRFRSQLGGIDSSGIDDRIATIDAGHGAVFKGARDRVQCSSTLFSIRETCRQLAMSTGKEQ